MLLNSDSQSGMFCPPGNSKKYLELMGMFLVVKVCWQGSDWGRDFLLASSDAAKFPTIHRIAAPLPKLPIPKGQQCCEFITWTLTPSLHSSIFFSAF